MDNQGFMVLVGGVPILVLVLGLVEFAKRLGVAGKWSLVLAMGVGTGVGVLYQVSLKPPASLAEWLGAAAYGLGLGLTASGLYDIQKRRGGSGSGG